MTKRSGSVDGAPRAPHIDPMAKRPPHVKPPAYLSKSPPVPLPDPLDAPREQKHDPDGALNPTRYGDWERKGVAVDF